MKTKRFVSTLLALLLVCSLPVSAFAEERVNTGPMENNDSPLNVNASTGTITNNNDYVLLNYGSITNNCEGGEVDNNNGAVGTNDGDIVDNGINDHGGTVGINNGQVKRNNEFSTVTTNNGKVTINNGTVSTNNGTVTDNYKTVDKNYGTVTNNGTEYEKTGTVKTNYNSVVTNYGTVTNNGTQDDHANAVVETNNFFVKNNYGVVSTNKNFVDNNNGTVTNNYDEIFENNKGAEVTDNKVGAVVHKNYGTVTTNNGTVERNLGGTVTTNNGTVNCNDDGGTVETNKGTVNNNFSQGTVSTNEGTVTENLGTVTTNEITGTVTNKNNGTVGTNYGTVNEADGTTHYGVQVDNDGDVSLAQKENGETWDLAQLFTKAGYVLTGFIQAYQAGENGFTQASTTVEGTSYTADCPNVLTLIWQAIYNPAADDGAGSFGPGSVISINGHKFLLVAVVEDVYCLASVDSFGDEALSDLPALLASLLTEEQLTHVTGEPELLDEALTARFFAGEGSHIVFPCDSGLIFS